MKKYIFIIITFFITLYLILYLIFINISILKYNEMDFNHNGFVELSETFNAIDIGERDITINGLICIEYFFYKDGLKASVRCIKHKD